MNILFYNNMYKVFDLIVESELALPELNISCTGGTADVVVKLANLFPLWSDIVGSKEHIFVEENLFMFKIPEAGIFLVRNGNEILFYPINDNKEDELRLYLLGTCMGAILLQRKTLPLHGSAIAIDGKAYAIVGESGAGKSTLAAAFLQKGYKLLSDDVIPIKFDNDGQPMVIPAYPHQKLWQESLDHFGQDSSKYQPIADRETKYAIPVTKQFEPNPMPLAGIFELNKTDNEEISIEPIDKLHQFHTLYKHTYRNFIVPRAGLMDWHFQTSVKIAARTDLYSIHRPTSRFTVEELTDLILNTIGREKVIL